MEELDEDLKKPKGQTYDPYGPNYIGPSNTGQAKSGLLSEVVMLGGVYAAVRNPLKAIEVIGTDPEDPRELSLELATQKAQLNPGNLTLGRVKRLKKGVERIADTVGTIVSGPKPAFATVNVDDGLFRSVVNQVTDTKFEPNNIFAATAKETHMAKLPRITTGSKQHTALVKKAQAYGEKHGTMMNFGNHYVDEKGVWRAFNWKKKTNKAGTLDQGGRFDRGVRRSAGVKLDEKTLRNQLGGDEKLFKQYKETNSTIFRKLGQEVKKINDAGVAKYGKQWERLEVEHIYDVQFFWKLQDEVPNFAGRGANEAINLKILKQRANASTGAQASTLSGSEALVKNLPDFPDYNKAVTEFTDFDMFNTVKKMKTSDWEALTQIVLENPDMNVHEVIVNFF